MIPENYIGLKVIKTYFKNDVISIFLENGINLLIKDDAQHCCEKRYMTTSDDINSIVGENLLNIFVKNCNKIESDCKVYEIAFLEIKTDKQSITFESHNEHNGYYGGFNLMIVFKDTDTGNNIGEQEVGRD